ncbi:hypothetical protein [Parendozoicomonas sp. Alg238-R29]|nr:hypothetical protein [Parendozoicomonas sp. Alg238-R29]
MNTKSPVYLGVEYSYWNNKYGLKEGKVPFDTDQRSLGLIAKVHF